MWGKSTSIFLKATVQRCDRQFIPRNEEHCKAVVLSLGTWHPGGSLAIVGDKDRDPPISRRYEYTHICQIDLNLPKDLNPHQQRLPYPFTKHFPSKMPVFKTHAFYRPRSEASEGYVFTAVCHSFCSTPGGGRWATPMVNHLPPLDNSTYPPPPPWTTAPTPPPGQQCLPPSSGQQHLPPPPLLDNSTYPLPPSTVNWRAVRILLECILVANLNSDHLKREILSGECYLLLGNLICCDTPNDVPISHPGALIICDLHSVLNNDEIKCLKRSKQMTIKSRNTLIAY